MTSSAAQHDILKELFNISLSKAADSLSFFIRNKILIKELFLSVPEQGNDLSMVQAQIQNAAIVLETMLKGDYTGKTYLLFSEKDVKNFFSVAHPINPNAKLEDEFSKELLLEVDNILTASVVTRLSDILGIKLYGDVPYLVSDTTSLCEKIASDSDNVFCLQVVARYISDGVVMEPQFIWLVDSLFFNRIKQFVEVEENVVLLKNMNISNG